MAKREWIGERNRVSVFWSAITNGAISFAGVIFFLKNRETIKREENLDTREKIGKRGPSFPLVTPFDCSSILEASFFWCFTFHRNKPPTMVGRFFFHFFLKRGIQITTNVHALIVYFPYYLLDV